MISVFFCGTSRHFQKDCLKFKAWLEKKGKPSAFTCLESNLAEVSYNTQWIDSGCTVHVSNTMQVFLTTQTINQNERYVYMGNRVNASVKAIGTYCLILDTGRHLYLLETCYVPSLLRNLVSLSKLDKTGYFFNFGNGCFSLFKHNYLVDTGTLCDNSYKLNLNSICRNTLNSAS